MKKIVTVIIFILCITTISMASNVSVSLSSDKTNVKKGEEVKIKISIKNFTREGTQKALEAKLEYDSEKLEYKSVNWKEGWSGVISTDGTGIAIAKSEEVNEDETIAEITYLVKENVEKGNTNVKIKEILTSANGDSVEADDAEVTISILGSNIGIIKIILPVCLIIFIILLFCVRCKKNN